MHQVRMVLVAGWLLLTASLFYDPISHTLTEPSNPWSPLSLDPGQCQARVQGVCLQEEPFSLGAPIFWGAIVPASIFILLVFGHEFWRRICPLSFLSQIPRALGIERKHKRENKKTGKVRYEVAKVPQDSWLAKNHLYFQLGLFYAGITARILFVNSDRYSLGAFFLFVMLAAILVGYLYGGKSWCHYFCPMAPVQKIYSEPRGLLGSTAHDGERQLITQSMCRTIGKDGNELSACVACNSPCLDIDAERHYWESIKDPQQQILRYGYVGLAVGYFLYYYLYAGTFEYYFSGAWAHEASQIALLTKPGFYIFGQAIPIPKFVAAPLTIGTFGALFYGLGRFLENRYLAFQLRRGKPLGREMARHRVFAVYTFFVFNYFYIFAGRNFVRLLPTPLRFAIPLSLGVCSAMWLYRTWQRDPNLYYREGIASRLRKQLRQLKLDLGRALEGRALEDLNADEVYILAKTLPDFSKDQRLQAYRGVLREAIDEGFVGGVGSFERFKRLRQELEVTDAEHAEVLQQLGQEDPSRFDPTQEHSCENHMRLESYRELLLEKILASWADRPEGARLADLLTAFDNHPQSDIDVDAALEEVVAALSARERRELQSIRQEYGISHEDEIAALRLSPPGELWHLVANKLVAPGAVNFQDPGSLQSVFERLDSDRSGDICPEELKQYVGELGFQFSDAQVEDMLVWADIDGNRRISYDEFCKIFKYLQGIRQAIDSAPTVLRSPEQQSQPVSAGKRVAATKADEGAASSREGDDIPTRISAAGDDAPTLTAPPQEDE